MTEKNILLNLDTELDNTKLPILLGSLAVISTKVYEMYDSIMNSVEYSESTKEILQYILDYIEGCMVYNGVLLLNCQSVECKQQLTDLGFAFKYLDKHNILVISIFGSDNLNKSLPDILARLDSGKSLH